MDARQPDNLGGKTPEHTKDTEAVGYDLDPNIIMHKEPDSTAGLRVTGPDGKDMNASQVLKLAQAGFRCAFQQKNPKKGASNPRYEKYKHCTSVQQFIDEKFSKGDFANDAARGFVKVFPPSSDDDSEENSDNESEYFGRRRKGASFSRS